MSLLTFEILSSKGSLRIDFKKMSFLMGSFDYGIEVMDLVVNEFLMSY